MSLTPTTFLARTDKLAAASIALTGTFASGLGCGSADPTLANDWGYSKKLREYEAAILSGGDRQEVEVLLGNAGKSADRAGKAVMLYALFFPLLFDLAQLCARQSLPSVTDINTFAGYYNTSTGGSYTALLAPEFAALYKLIYASVPIAAANIYSPAIANMGQFVVGGAFAAGTAVDSTQYAGAARAAVVITGSTFTGSGTIAVSGSSRGNDGIIRSARIFTATAGADGTFYLVPTIAGDILVSVSSITLPGTMTAGTAVVAAQIPAGRTAPPA